MLSQVPLHHLIAEIEPILQLQTDKKIQDHTRCNITNAIHNYIHKFNNQANTKPEQKIISNAYATTSKFLKSNPEICVLPADKGNRTVIMMTKDYDTKMLELLKDDNTYTTTKSDPTTKFQTINNNFATRLLKLHLIDRYTATKLKTTTATCPRIYGQPKAHKQNVPLRPVVPGMTNPCYQLSKYICCILQASMESKYNTKDSFSFCREIRDTVIPHNHIMVSFDVISLFTNIPRDLVIRDIINRWDTIKPHTKINLDLFLEIVSFCMHASYFVFRGTHYIQKEGTAMGSPLSPILADLVMDTLLDSVQKQLSYTIPTLRKYVDDLFLIVPADQLQHTLNVFNGYHHNIQFTCEEECEGKLPYLDMTVIRQPDNTIQTEWFIKPIASGRLLNFNSIHPLSQKIAIMQNFIDRVNKLSTIMDEDTKRTIITKHLLINDFPRHLINRCLNRTNWNNNLPITKPSQDINNNNNITTYRSIPSIPLLSQQVIRLFRETYPTVKVTTRSTNTVNKLYTRIKDPVPFLDQHSVIYRVSCQCNWNYIGMTGSLLKNRLAKHRSNIKQLNQLIEQGYTAQDEKMQAMKTTSTALIAHCIDHQHKFDLSSVKILDHTYKQKSLPILEMIHIFNEPKSVNKRTDVANLNSTYAGVLHSIHRHTQKEHHNKHDNKETNNSTSSIQSTVDSDTV